MRLVDVCESLFQYICYANRVGRAGGSIPAGTLEAEMVRLLEDIKTKCRQDATLAQAYNEDVEWGLMFFCDFMIRDSKLPAAMTWKGIAVARGNLAGDEQFFDLLDKISQETGDLAKQRQEVFYHCLGLGFTGMYRPTPESTDGLEKKIRPKMRELYARMGAGSGESSGRLVPEAYENIDKRVFTRSSRTPLLVMLTILAVMIPGALIANWVAGQQASKDLGAALDEVSTRHQQLRSPAK
jgi:type VI protein secretion system component VasF